MILKTQFSALLKSISTIIGRKTERIRLLENLRIGEPALVMEGIVKRFSGVIANDYIDFEVRKGEIHALLGENGAGKSTLMNILYGLYRADEGKILLGGEEVNINSPKDALELGIGMVHQHFMLVNKFTVKENLALGSMSPKGLLIENAKITKRVEELTKKYGLKLDLDCEIWQLSVGEQQRVEITKALYQGADLLVLDEPTSVLTPQEVKELFMSLRRMVAEGLTIIFITHKLNEIMAISNRVTVLRKGKHIATLDTSRTSRKELAKLVLGEEFTLGLEKPSSSKSNNEILLVKNLWALDDLGIDALKGISFSLKKGEILGVVGVSGNGQKELAEVITGLRRAKNGEILLKGNNITGKTPEEISKKGVGYIPEDRMTTGLLMDFTVAENEILKAPLLDKLFLNRREISKYAEDAILEFDIRTPSKDTPTKHLSGGNLQKLILSRELRLKPQVLIAAQPTRGLDVRATQYIWNKLLTERLKGVGILLISEDLDEIFCLSDRIMIFFDGYIVGEGTPKSFSIEEIGKMMTGTKRLDCGKNGKFVAEKSS